MATLTRSLGGFLSPKRQVPSGALAIDKAHPLANGLLACYVPGVTGGQNLSLGGGDLAFLSASAVGVSREGPGLKSTASTSGMTALAPASFKGLHRYSLYYRGYCLGASSTSAGFIGISYDNANGSPWDCVELGATGSGSTTAMQLAYGAGGSFASNANLGALTANTDISIGGTFVDNGGALIPYKNGLAQTPSTSSASSFDSSATSLIELNTYGGATARYANAICYIACIWGRDLSASEMAWIDADPYGFLAPAESTLPVFYSGGTTTSASPAAASLIGL